MGLTGNHLVSLLLYIFVVNEIRLPLVTCQDEDNTQCMPKAAFLALLRHPEVSSNLAAYSRTARITQDAKSRNDMAHLRALTEEADDTEICVPGRVYLQLLKDPVMRGDLSIILNGRTQKLPDLLGRLLDDSDEMDAREFLLESQKRGLATLAKNDDLPISIQDRIAENEDDEEKRAAISSEQPGQNDAGISRDYLLSGGRSDLQAFARDFQMEKRNVGALARDFALPPGRRNIASLVRDYDQSKSNNRESTLPYNGKRNVASLARTFTLPQNGKRNVASVARDYGLPYGKRYVGSLARTGDFPARNQRSIASLAKNSAWPVSLKRGIFLPGSVILRALSRHGRSMVDETNARNDLLDLQELSNLEQSQRNDYETAEEKLNDSLTKIDSNIRRPKRQIDFSDEYPLPVMQNTNGFDYEEMMEALSGQYPNAEKRFMETGSAPEMQPEVDQFGYPETFQASKRHIGALARLGWLPSLRVARFSRSLRYPNGRENPADGPPSDYSANSSTRSLRPNFKSRKHSVQALHGDCRHGFKRFLVLPTTDNYFHEKLPYSLRSKSS
ncbi:neuropeptide-like precursor 1 isoform X4 [Bombus vancouverensis nearcticus]|uniref:Neuropeptide-like 1 isoform X1 n=1 Tax=Bombus bifarius TaxID=103933 RepID=A0A6P8LLG2_9HYME|nr:neuropeptide-like 1 isoform X1 [Bombus vancouverensis nearcticus]XP_033299089.1 neuropeptide-like 1 isoform X1 [Bombus bifarius]